MFNLLGYWVIKLPSLVFSQTYTELSSSLHSYLIVTEDDYLLLLEPQLHTYLLYCLVDALQLWVINLDCYAYWQGFGDVGLCQIDASSGCYYSVGCAYTLEAITIGNNIIRIVEDSLEARFILFGSSCLIIQQYQHDDGGGIPRCCFFVNQSIYYSDAFIVFRIWHHCQNVLAHKGPTVHAPPPSYPVHHLATSTLATLQP
jgi:hypothetical protein